MGMTKTRFTRPEEIEKPMLTQPQREDLLLRLRVSGKSFHRIAQDLDYPDEEAAYEAYKKVCEKRYKASEQTVQEHVNLEISRIDAALEAMWPQVENGSPRAVQTMLQLMDRRSKYLGLDKAQKIEITKKSVEEMTEQEIDAIIAKTKQALNVKDGTVH